MYSLIVAILVTVGEPPVEVRIPFNTHEECMKEADAITRKINRYAGLFGARVDTSGCFKT
jgi:hypothetical protein